MPLTPGARIGFFEILAPLGAGGMGEVYRARDTRLGRDVAIKTLPEDLNGNPERLMRLQREAQLLAALNHPHIATIHSLEALDDGGHCLVLELVEGESLADAIARGRLPLDQAMTIARQIVDAVEAAHDKGIIHRDLKPANVMLTHDGQVKVLDFGLARAVEGDGSVSVTNSPTLSFAATQAGVILGTAAYMSPEQAKGRVADRRTDVWAFGCILFEMLSGKRAFDGEDVSDILAGIIRGEPDWGALPANVPEPTRTLIRRCLEKDRRARIPDMSVVRFMMAEPATAAAPATRQAARVRRRQVALVALAGIAAGIALAAGTSYLRRLWNPPPLRPQVRFAIVPPPSQPMIVTGADRTIAISPDGKYIAYASGRPGESVLAVRPIGQLDAVVLAGTGAVRQPFFSPDSRWIGFFSGSDLKKIAVTGGPATTICQIGGSAPRGAAWTENDTILFATASPADGLMSVSAAGGTPRSVSKPAVEKGERDHTFPSALPGAQAVLFAIRGQDPGDAQIAALDLASGNVTPLVAGSQAEFVGPDYLVFATSGSLRAVRFDPKRLKVLGEPVPVLEGVTTASSGATYFALTRTGDLLFVPGGLATAANRLVWMDRTGREQPIPAPPRSYTNPRLSPDDTRVALDVRDQQNDIWIWHFARQTLDRVTFEADTDANPIWTKDGGRIVFNKAAEGRPGNLFWQPANGTGQPERLSTSTNLQVPMWISSGASTLLFMEISVATGPDLMLLHRDGTPRTVPLLQTSFSESIADVSPDGRWIAYQSNETGAAQIYVRPFPNVDQGRWQVSVAGGTRPVWGRDGKELFFQSDGVLMAVPVQTTSAFVAGQPAKLFDSGAYLGLPGRPFDVSRDSQRFLVVKGIPEDKSEASPPAMVVVVNWIEELNTRVPRR